MGRRKLVSDEALLAVARAVFVEQGVTGSTRVIARRAGLSEAAIFQRYTTKVDLFFAAMVPPALDVEALLSRSEGGDSLEQLEEVALGMLDYFRRLVPILLPLVTHPSFQFEEFARRHPDTPLNRLRTGLQRYMEELHPIGDVPADSPSVAPLALFSALFSLAFFERLGAHDGTFDDQMVRGMIRVLWHGMASTA